MSGWFRAYESALDDPKVQRLPGELFKSWFNILCLACRHNGELPPIADIAFALRKSEATTQETINKLIESELLDKTETGLQPHNWNGRQFKGDVSTERVKRFRKRHETVSETPSDTEQNRAETDRAFQRFTETALSHNWPKPLKLTDDRRKKIRARLDEHGEAGWEAMLAKASASEWINTQFRLKLDWVLEPRNFVKVIEGNYDSPDGAGPKILKFN